MIVQISSVLNITTSRGCGSNVPDTRSVEPKDIRFGLPGAATRTTSPGTLRRPSAGACRWCSGGVGCGAPDVRAELLRWARGTTPTIAIHTLGRDFMTLMTRVSCAVGALLTLTTLATIAPCRRPRL